MEMMVNTGKAILSIGKKEIQVQYNPKSIRIGSHTEIIPQQNEQKQGDEKEPSTKIKPGQTYLEMELMFDKVDNQDAFFTDKRFFSAGGFYDKYQNRDNKTYSVQTQINEIMNLLFCDSTNHIKFYWGNMCFAGKLTEASPQFTMFQPGGNPIRGSIKLKIQKKPDTMDAADKKYWNKAFSKVFGE